MDKNGNAKIIDYSSLMSKFVTSSVAAAGLPAMVHGLNFLSIMQLKFNVILDYAVPLSFYTGFQSLYAWLVHIHRTTKKCVLIDLRMFCKFHARH